MKKADKSNKITPFDFINAINSKSGKDLIETNEADYNSFIVNKFFGFFPDTIFFANEMNRYSSSLSNKAQFDFYYEGLMKKKRWTKWVREDKSRDDELRIIMEYYGCSSRDAKETLSMLDEKTKTTFFEQANFEVRKGGKSNNTK